MKPVYKILYAVLILVFLVSCGKTTGVSKKPTYPTPLSGEMKQAFNSAEQAYSSGKMSEATGLYQSYIVNYGYNELTDEAKFKLGEISFMNKNYEKALSHYRDAYANLYNPSITPKSQFKASLSLYYLKRFGETFALLDSTERRDMSNILRMRTDSLALKSGRASKNGRDSLIKWYLFLIDDYAAVAPDDISRIQEGVVEVGVAEKVVGEWVKDSNVSLSEVDALPLKFMKGKPSGGYLFYKLAMTNYANGNIQDAEKYLRQFVRTYPKNEYVQSADALLAELKGKVGGRSYKVGVLLPISGKFALYGNSALHGIQCAAGLTPPCNSPYKIELIVKDTAGDSEVAVQEIEELAKEGVIAIIGPLLSSTDAVATAKAQELKIPIISLSQKEDSERAGDYVFKNSLTSTDQVNTLVNYATGTRKLKKFGILYPTNPYGSQFAEMFRSAVENAGGKVIYQKGYSHEDLRPAKAPDEEGSYSELGSGAVSKSQPEFQIPSSVEAVFIPDSYKAVKYVVGAVHKDNDGISPGVLFMGVNRWNNPGLTSSDIGLLEGSVFVDGFFKESSDVTTRNFVQNFTHAFGMDPTILEAQAFDALKIIESGISGGGTTRTKLASAIHGVKNMGGATGSISIGSNGNSFRKLFILTVKNGAIAELSSARGLINTKNYSYSQTSKNLSDEKYEGRKTPNLSVRTGLPKYESTDFFDKEME